MSTDPQPPQPTSVKPLLVLLSLVVIVGGALFWYAGQSSNTDPTTANASTMFVGLREASAQEIQQALPDTQAQPTLLMFHSRFCLDCKKMRPVIDKVIPQYNGLTYKEFDIMDDRKDHPGVFNVFEPVSVPTLVFITPGGHIQNVLYNYHSEAEITNAVDKLVSTVPKN